MKSGSILLTGASGKLGSALRALDFGSNTLLTPSRNELDITNEESVRRFFQENSIGAVIHCAALTDMKRCESNPSEAMAVNFEGTERLVKHVLACCPGVRFVYLSTDYVYPSLKGPYSEGDPTRPFNTYAQSKLAGEASVRALANHCIVRTSFFDPARILFDSAPSDAFCSKIPFEEGARAIKFLLESNFKGIINVGRERISLYHLLKPYKEGLRAISLEEVNRTAPVKRAPDSSLDIVLWKKLRGLQ